MSWPSLVLCGQIALALFCCTAFFEVSLTRLASLKEVAQAAAHFMIPMTLTTLPSRLWMAAQHEDHARQRGLTEHRRAATWTKEGWNMQSNRLRGDLAQRPRRRRTMWAACPASVRGEP